MNAGEANVNQAPATSHFKEIVGQQENTSTEQIGLGRSDNPALAGNPVAVSNNDVADNIALAPTPRENAIERIIPPGINQPLHTTLTDLVMMEGPERFEFGFDASSPGVTLPSNGFNLNPFGYEVRLAYNLDENDQVAFHFGNEYYQWLNVVSTKGDGFTSITGSMGAQKRFASYELFYDRVQPIADGRLYLTAGVGGGFYTVGNLLSAELGFKVPISERMLAGITFTLTRAHQNGPSEQEVLTSQTLPAIYSGQDIHNTLNGMIQYGLSYRF
jgi:hypothetical protein